MTYGITADNLRDIISSGKDYVIVDICDYGRKEVKIKNAFEISYDEIPNNLSSVPMYFVSINTILISDDETKSRNVAENYRSQGADQCFYFVGGISEFEKEFPELSRRL